jgi:hypothetical protein
MYYSREEGGDMSLGDDIDVTDPFPSWEMLKTVISAWRSVPPSH